LTTSPKSTNKFFKVIFAGWQQDFQEERKSVEREINIKVKQRRYSSKEINLSGNY
jgi:hypothetical protein